MRYTSPRRHNLFASAFTYLVLCTAPPAIQGQAGPPSRQADTMWLRNLADTTADTSLRKQRTRNWKGQPQAPLVRLPSTVPPHQYMRHIFGQLAPNSAQASFFYDQGILDSASAALFSNDSSWTYLDTNQFFRFLTVLRSMRINNRVSVPGATAFQDHANQVYKLSGLVPIGIVDVAVYMLDSLTGDSLGVTRQGRLLAKGRPKYRRKQVFVAAPLLQGVPANQVRLFLDTTFMIRTDSRKPSYELVTGGRPVQLDTSGVGTVPLTTDVTHFALRNKSTKQTAVTTILRYSMNAPPANTRIALLRRSSDTQSKFRFLKVIADAEGAVVSQSPALDEGWTPEIGGLHGAHVYSPDKWGGIEIGVWWSAKNQDAAEADRDIEPLIVVSGADKPTTEPQTMYLLLKERLGDAALNLLRSRFDIFIFGYWAGGSNDDCSDPSGNVSGCRAQGIERPIKDNAAFVADAMRFIYSHYNISKKATVLGFSMGGNVSRLAFLGIENGPSAHLGEQAFQSIPGFPVRTVPVRVWITIDTPHQGAYIPLGLQSWVEGISWLPGLEADTRLLDAPSSKELLVEHHSASNSCAENCEWFALGSPRTQHKAAPERAQFSLSLSGWGSFPKTVDTSIAVASGSFEMPRPQLWKLQNGKIPLTWEVCSFGECWEAEALPADPTVRQVLDLLADITPINNFNVLTSTIDPVAEPSSAGFAGYAPLAPNALPLHIVNRELFAMKDDNKTISARLHSLITEVSYAPETQSQIQEPEGLFDVSNSSAMSKIQYLRARLAFTLSGEFKVSALGGLYTKWVPIDIGGSSETPLSLERKPLAFEAGGFRRSIRQVDSSLTDAFGTSIASVFSPRHTFIATVSALDLSTDFLRNAYSARVLNSSVNMERYGRGKGRGEFERDDYIDWKPFQDELATQKLGDCIYRGKDRIIRQGGATIWSGDASPFTFLVCQSQSLEHTFMEEKAVRFVLERIFNDPVRTVRPFEPPFDRRMFEMPPILPPLLPPLPWPPLPQRDFNGSEGRRAAVGR